jgi:curved DNA-binding protein
MAMAADMKSGCCVVWQMAAASEEHSMQSRDYYSVLGVDRSATGDQIKSAFRRLAQRFHPDVTDDPDGESKFKAVAEAYRTLKRPDTRMAYNRQVLHIFGPGTSTGIDWAVSPLHAWFALCQWPGWAWYWSR